MNNLEIINRRIAVTAKEKVNEREILYNWETTETEATPTAVSFSMFGSDGKTLSGSYTQNGGFALNGRGITHPNDLQIVQKAFATILEIITPKNNDNEQTQN